MVSADVRSQPEVELSRCPCGGTHLPQDHWQAAEGMPDNPRRVDQ